MPLAIFSYSEGKVVLDVIIVEEIVPLEHATLLPVSLPGKLAVEFCCKDRHYFTISKKMLPKNEKNKMNEHFIPNFEVFCFKCY